MEKSAKYTLLRTFGRLFRLIFNSLDSLHITLIYGVLLAVIYYLFVVLYNACSGSAICYNTITALAILFPTIITAFYIDDLYQSTFKNSVFKLREIIKFNTNRLKKVSFTIAYFLSFVISGYLAIKILKKPANPVWQIEFIFFCILFAISMLPIAAMRFSAIVAYYLHDQRVPSIKYMYDKTIGRSYIGVVGFLLLILFLSVLNMQIFTYEAYLMHRFPHFITSLAVVYFIMITLLFSLSIIICFFEAQRQLLEDNPSVAAVEELGAESVPSEETPTKSKSSEKPHKRSSESTTGKTAGKSSKTRKTTSKGKRVTKAK